MEKTENSTPYSPRYGEAETGGTGRLKIFFGYAAGVGKTYAMLEAAHQAQKEGVDVVVGYVEPHARPDTLALLEGLEVLSCREVDYRGIRLREFDLDGALARRPQLILVDELAHSNAPGCRHTKRYQDVEELLQAGINVYTTVNVQHLESLNDLVTSITGIVVNERIPDHVFDRANQVELVDIAPADLEKRLEEGKIYRQRQAKQALENFFTAENLTALREIAMRRTADQLNRTAVQEKKGKAARAGDHILICLSSAPSNAKVIPARPPGWPRRSTAASRRSLSRHRRPRSCPERISNACGATCAWRNSWAHRSPPSMARTRRNRSRSTPGSAVSRKSSWGA